MGAGGIVTTIGGTPDVEDGETPSMADFETVQVKCDRCDGRGTEYDGLGCPQCGTDKDAISSSLRAKGSIRVVFGVPIQYTRRVNRGKERPPGTSVYTRRRGKKAHGSQPGHSIGLCRRAIYRLQNSSTSSACPCCPIRGTWSHQRICQRQAHHAIRGSRKMRKSGPKQ